MICPFCSLLCDADDLREIHCDRRAASLAEFHSIRPVTAQSNRTNFVPLLKSAKRMLITGRIASVETARAAVAFAAKFNATIDCAESGHIFKNVLAIQRSGLNSVSLAEARDHTDVFIVVGDDSMQSAVPRLPSALSNGNARAQTVLLLGEFSSVATEQWQNAGFDTWAIPCDLTAVPSALAQWSLWIDRLSNETQKDGARANPLFERMRQSRYMTLVWTAECLKMKQPDLWVERLLQWIASRNEANRCAALLWSSTDGTFQQVCTWLTGFPGRIAFKAGVPRYDPDKYSYEKWIESTPIGVPHESVIVLIDETINSVPFLLPQQYPALNEVSLIELTARSEQFPTAVTGVEISADIFRADQCLLARVQASCGPRPSVKSATHWLQELSK
jgi:formylmethanofuran dehydrogenase subunit B